MDDKTQHEPGRCFLPSDLSPTKSLAATFIYTSLGRAFNFGDVCIPVIGSDVAHMAAFLAKLPQLVKDGLVKPLLIRLWEGGFLRFPTDYSACRRAR